MSFIGIGHSILILAVDWWRSRQIRFEKSVWTRLVEKKCGKFPPFLPLQTQECPSSYVLGRLSCVCASSLIHPAACNHLGLRGDKKNYTRVKVRCLVLLPACLPSLDLHLITYIYWAPGFSMVLITITLYLCLLYLFYCYSSSCHLFICEWKSSCYYALPDFVVFLLFLGFFIYCLLWLIVKLFIYHLVIVMDDA